MRAPHAAKQSHLERMRVEGKEVEDSMRVVCEANLWPSMILRMASRT